MERAPYNGRQTLDGTAFDSLLSILNALLSVFLAVAISAGEQEIFSIELANHLLNEITD